MGILEVILGAFLSDSDEDHNEKICDGCGEEPRWCKCTGKVDPPSTNNHGGGGFFGGGAR